MITSFAVCLPDRRFRARAKYIGYMRKAKCLSCFSSAPQRLVSSMGVYITDKVSGHSQPFYKAFYNLELKQVYLSFFV